MKRSGFCECGAEINDSTRVSIREVLCSACGNRTQLYARRRIVYNVRFVTAQETDRQAFFNRLQGAGLQDVEFFQEPDNRTSTVVTGKVTYDVRGNWNSDIRAKISDALTKAGVPARKDQIHVSRER